MSRLLSILFPLIVFLTTIHASDTGIPDPIRVKFLPQEHNGELPAGYLPDNGQLFTAHQGGSSYGWSKECAARSVLTGNFLRNGFVRARTCSRWSIDLANGHYLVRVITGAGDHYRPRCILSIEGERAYGTPTLLRRRFSEVVQPVTVDDGRLDIGFLRCTAVNMIEVFPSPAGAFYCVGRVGFGRFSRFPSREKGLLSKIPAGNMTRMLGMVG